MEYRYSRALVSIALCGTALFSASYARASTASTTQYLDAHAQSPWAVMALASLGETPDTTSLQSATSATAIGLEAPILALTAAHKDPTTYPTSDLVQSLKSYYTQGQIGDPATLNDDLFGVLALISAGVSAQDAVVLGTRTFIAAHQNKDGGWPFMVDDVSDTNSTAAAIMALIASGTSPSDASIVQALAYLHAAQNSDGGFPYDPKSQWGTASDASSDAWVILALLASDIDESSWATAGGTPMYDLLSYQTPTGYFEFQHGSGEDAFTAVTTSYAALAISGKTLPIAILSLPPKAPPSDPTPPSQPAASKKKSGGGGGLTSFGSTVLASTTEQGLASTTLGIVLGTSTVSVGSKTQPTVEATTTEGSSYLLTYNLQLGMQDAAVVELQKKLIAHRMLSIIIPTGWFGPLTQKAIKTFQEQNEIPATGFVGAMTRASLNAWK